MSVSAIRQLYSRWLRDTSQGLGTQRAPAAFTMCHAKAAMRDAETIETDLMEISATPDDVVKLERIVAWCASHPDEVPFALHQLMRQKDQRPAPQTDADREV